MKQSVQETHPKFHEHQMQQQQQHQRNMSKHKMNFNWRANWEILLVLVIIVVGIVITTIAAIRNKDKHLLILPDDTDYGQLLASGGEGQANANGSPDFHQQHHVPALPQTDFQMNSGQTWPGEPGGGSGTPSLATSSKRNVSPKAPTNQRSGTVNGHRARAVQQQQQSQSLAASRPLNSHSAGQPNELGATQTAPLAGQEAYEALGTEATPSQTADGLARPAGQREPVGVQEDRLVSGEQQADELDDFHTTRSASAAGKSGRSEPAGAVTPSLALHGPYGLMLPTLLSGQHLDSALLNLSRSASSGDQQQQQQSTPSLGGDADDMMTSYSRAPLNGGSTEGSYGSSPPPPPPPNATASDEPTSEAARQRAASHSLPFSLLLNDLIKLARPSLGQQQQQHDKPQQTANQNQNQHQNQHQNNQNNQNNNNNNNNNNSVNRLQYSGLLQQLRSLPAPVLALLQGANFGAAPAPNSAAGTGGQPDFPLVANMHDVSESSHYYQQIPMASTNGMHSLNGPSALPAFPPPKGTPQVWYPPTVGGNAQVHEAMNSNADFVASNAAGFLRAPVVQSGAPSELQQQQQQSMDYSADGQQQAAANGGYQRQASAETMPSSATSGGQPMNIRQLLQPQAFATGQQQQQHQHQLMQQFQYQQQQQQQQQQILPNGQQLARGAPSLGPALLANQLQQISEMQQVPLGYQPQPQPSMRPASMYDFGTLPSESAPRASVASGSGPRQASAAAPPHQPMGAAKLGAAGPGQRGQLGAAARQKRSVAASLAAQLTTGQPTGTTARGQEVAGLAAAAAAEVAKRRVLGEDEELEELLDSRPVSIVLPDGRPAEASAASVASTVTARQRQVNDLDLDQSALHHYATSDSEMAEARTRTRRPGNKSPTGGADGERKRSSARKKQLREPGSSRRKLAGGRRGASSGRRKNLAALEAAGSGLMSKLLGTASTNDELEDEFDGDDEDGVQERRKEELDDAEFGITNERPNSIESGADERTGGRSVAAELGRLLEANGAAEPAEKRGSDAAHLGAGSSDSEAYTRRLQQQQRADIEFYGHPGEETRQLKYGILGSGNYEVVNGGIYPEADESTAAVNSVANYVRKPGALLAGLSKLAGPQAAAYMPGGRIGGGFMRGASASADELGAAGLKGLQSPLLELIDANAGHLFDPSLVAQLGSSGTSARTTFTSKERDQDDAEHEHEHQLETEAQRAAARAEARRKEARKRAKLLEQLAQLSDKENNETDEHPVDSRQKPAKRNKLARQHAKGAHLRALGNSDQPEVLDQSPASDTRLHASPDEPDQSGRQTQGSGKSPGTNQFYSYQISPSKKVTIFSDQDLDSAPSELEQFRTTPSGTPHRRST